MIVAIAGIRDLHPGSVPDVQLAVASEFAYGARELRFGDAAGVDMCALEGACLAGFPRARLKVYVVGSAEKLAKRRRDLVEQCATHVVELGLRPGQKWAYDKQAKSMLNKADKLLAFTDGRHSGGTWSIIQLARSMGVPVDVVPVASIKSPLANPQLVVDTALAPIHGVFLYTRKGGSEAALATKLMLQLGSGRGGVQAVGQVARSLVDYIEADDVLVDAEFIACVPRRLPGLEPSTIRLAREVGSMTGKTVLEEWLVRDSEPGGVSVTISGRAHFQTEAHAESMSVVGDEMPDSLILLDDVIAYTGTMVGAQRAVERDARIKPAGLAVVYVKGLAP